MSTQKQPLDLNGAKKIPKGVYYVLIAETPGHLFQIILIGRNWKKLHIVCKHFRSRTLEPFTTILKYKMGKCQNFHSHFIRKMVSHTLRKTWNFLELRMLLPCLLQILACFQPQYSFPYSFLSYFWLRRNLNTASARSSTFILPKSK